MNRNFMFGKKPEDTPPPDMKQLIAETEAMNRIYSVTTDIFLVPTGFACNRVVSYNNYYYKHE